MDHAFSAEEVRALVEQFYGKRILVVGDLMADKFIWGEGVRLSTEAPVPVLYVDSESYELGGAANVAKAGKLMRADVELCGLLGYDDGADFFRKALSASGISSSGVFPTTHRPTTLKVRIMAKTYLQQMLRMDYESHEPLHDDERASLMSAIHAFMPGTNALILADHSKGIFGNEDFVRDVTSLAQSAGVPIIADTKKEHFPFFSASEVVISHIREAREFLYANNYRNLEDPAEIGTKMVDLLGYKAYIMYMDDQGLAMFEKNKPPLEVTGKSRQVFDISGLGDTITAVTALSLAAGLNISTAARLAWRAGSIVLSKVGMGSVTPEELITS